MSQSISRRGFLGLVAAGTAGLIAACSTSESTTETSTESTATDNTGDQRVVALNTGQLDNLLRLGVLPVGVAYAKGADLIPQYIRDEFGAQFDLDSIVNCGQRAEPEIEAIATLNPTLICANSRTDETILNKLREIAPVVTGEGGGENWKQDLLTIAGGVGLDTEAQELLDAYEAEALSIKENQPNEAPTVSFLRTKADSFQMYGIESMAGTVARDCGFNRPDLQQFTDEAGKDLSAENLGEADADWIFYGVQDGSPDPSETAVWPTLTAVQADQAVEIDYDSWFMNASLLSAQTILAGLQEHIRDH